MTGLSRWSATGRMGFAKGHCLHCADSDTSRIDVPSSAWGLVSVSTANLVVYPGAGVLFQ